MNVSSHAQEPQCVELLGVLDARSPECEDCPRDLKESNVIRRRHLRTKRGFKP
jgi:hypothetical protein